MELEASDFARTITIPDLAGGAGSSFPIHMPGATTRLRYLDVRLGDRPVLGVREVYLETRPEEPTIVTLLVEAEYVAPPMWDERGLPVPGAIDGVLVNSPAAEECPWEWDHPTGLVACPVYFGSITIA